MANLPTLEEQVKTLTKQVNEINEFLNMGEEATEIKAPTSEEWGPEEEKAFFETLALGNRRYGGGNGKTICQVNHVDHQ